MREVVCSRLLPAWLLRLDGNILELLHRIDVENCAETALDVLKAVFKGTLSEELQQNRVQLDNRSANQHLRSALRWKRAPEVIDLVFSPTGGRSLWSPCPVRPSYTGELCVSSSRLKETMVMKCWSRCCQMLQPMLITFMGEM